jgi:hypothetical protein
MSAKKAPSPETSLELSEVTAQRRSRSRRSASPRPAEMSTAISLTRATASWAACRKARMMACGWTPSSTKDLHSRRNSAARRTTVVVPSPTSASCDSEMSVSVLAAGCTISRVFMMVAPSLEMVTLPCATGGRGV